MNSVKVIAVVHLKKANAINNISTLASVNFLSTQLAKVLLVLLKVSHLYEKL